MAQDSQASKYRSCFICSGGFPTIPAPKWWEEESYNIQYFHYKNTMLKNLSWEKMILENLITVHHGELQIIVACKKGHFDVVEPIQGF